jgi:TATA-binding protein-associated factor
VCPPTLVAHWADEVENYLVNKAELRVLQYVGQPGERRTLLRKQIATHDLVVMSYDTLRSDHVELADHAWCYCVLDEGHVIKNAKTKLSQVRRRRE